ncbi:MAG: integrase, partial [Richelia sp. SM1_7_0]|nr:integrase [Richelia sp. SM1_7_0]
MSDQYIQSVTVLESTYTLSIGDDFCIDGDPDVI